MPATPAAANAPLPAAPWRAAAGLALLALWLGWSAAALVGLARPPLPPSHWSADQVLAQLPAALLQQAHGRPILLRHARPCACSSRAPRPAAALPAGLTPLDHPTPLPFDWLVLDAQRRLVYAGPAQLESSCGQRSPSAAALVMRLLAKAQAPVILPSHCPCRQE